MREGNGRIDYYEKLLYNSDMRDCKLLSVENAAELLSSSRSTIYKYVNSGDLKAIKMGDRTMIKVLDLVNFINTREGYKGCPNEV